MSRALYFYLIRTVSFPLPDVIDLDAESAVLPEDTEFTAERNSAAWMRELGSKHVITRENIDFFGAAEKLFGKRAESVSASSRYYLSPTSPDAKISFGFRDGSAMTATRDQLKPYYYTETFDAYAYTKELVATVPAYLLPNDVDDNKILGTDDVLRLVEGMLKGDTEPEYTSPETHQAVYDLMRVYTAIKDGANIVCITD